MTKENVMTDSELLKKINNHNRNYKYNFSNHYFINKLWKKDYIEKYGSLPANVPIQAKKVSEYINAQTGKVEKELPKGAKEIVLRLKSAI